MSTPTQYVFLQANVNTLYVNPTQYVFLRTHEICVPEC
jgi:hypothetical protein